MAKLISISDKSKHNTERWTSLVLRGGIWISGCVMIVGLIIASVFPSSVISNSENPSLYYLVSNLFSGTLDPNTLMFAGLALLMLTPILRVVTTMIGFAIEQDWRFVSISAIVLIMLIFEIFYSMLIK